MKAELCQFDEKGELETIAEGEITDKQLDNTFIGYGGDVYTFSEMESNEGGDVAIYLKAEKVDFVEKQDG